MLGILEVSCERISRLLGIAIMPCLSNDGDLLLAKTFHFFWWLLRRLA